MINLRVESGATKADFSTGANAYVVSESATLKKGNWYFDQDVTVAAGVTLTIEAGATIYLDPGKKLIVNGTLNAVGTSSSGITFNRSGSSSTWSGIQFNNGSSGNLQYCNIYYATNGISLYNSSPQIK